MPRVKSQAWGFYQGQAHLLSVRSQMSVTAAGPMWNRKPKEWGRTLRYYWLSGPHWGDPQKFWECTCSSCVPSETGHIYPHLDRSLCHCPLLISAPHSGRLWLCVHDEYSFCGPPLAAEARAREMAGCTGPRGAGTVADGGCGGFGGGSGGLRTPRVQALVLGLVFDRSSAEVQVGSCSFFRVFRSFPTSSGGDEHRSSEVDPLNRRSQSHSDRALQSHSQGLSLRRRYSRAGSRAILAPDSSVKELLNRKRVVRRRKSWKAWRSIHWIRFWCRSRRSRTPRPRNVFWRRLHKRLPWRKRWLKFRRSMNRSSSRNSSWLSCHRERQRRGSVGLCD